MRRPQEPVPGAGGGGEWRGGAVNRERQGRCPHGYVEGREICPDCWMRGRGAAAPLPACARCGHGYTTHLAVRNQRRWDAFAGVAVLVEDSCRASGCGCAGWTAAPPPA